MRKTFFLFLAIFILQFYTSLAQEYKRWGVSVHGGIPVMQGDRDIKSFSGALGVSAKYAFANNFNVRAMLLGGQMLNKNLGSVLPYYESTSNFVEVTTQCNLNLVNFKKKGTGRNVSQLYVGAGLGYHIGLLSYTGTTSNVTQPEVSSLIVPYGAGFKWFLNSSFDLGVEVSQRLTFTDQIDGYESPAATNRSNDFYILPQVFLTYNLGATKNDRSIEWVEPAEQVYDELIKTKLETNQRIEDMKKDHASTVNSMRENFEQQLAENRKRSDSLINAFRESYKNDSDEDGVSDVFDKEPNTPAGALVDGSGRAMDTDKDSIPDYRDKCPTQAGRAANNGCPVQASRDQLMVINDGIKNLQFETGVAVIKPSSFPALDKLAQLLVDNEIFLFRIDGHTDNVGDSLMNISLSQGRADAVKSYLVSKGVEASRISATGYGSSRPVVSNTTEAGRARNRRVDMQIE
jgi:OOP family OmpA-OmpF porin